MIELKNVSKTIDNNCILSNINITFEEGNIYGLIGRNGSGKTMLLNSICGFIKPSEGIVLINGKDIYKEKKFSEDTRALIENPKFLGNLSGFNNLKLLASINKKISDDEILKTLDVVNLKNDKNKLYSKYSLGMKQKLGIAQVLMENPKIMIFDEPFNGLDNDSAEKIRKTILEEREKGKIIIIATHIKDDIKQLCNKIYEMDNGTLKAK